MAKFDKQIEKLRAGDPKLAVTFTPDQSAIAVLRGKLAPPIDKAKLKKAPFIEARRFIKENQTFLGNIDESTQLTDGRTTTDRWNMTHVAFQQKHGTAEVLGGVVSVHYAADGSVNMLKSDLATAIDVPSTPKVTAAKASAIAIAHAGKGYSPIPVIKTELIVVDAKTVHQEEQAQKYYLCWRMGIMRPKGSRGSDWIYLVNAMDGKVLLRYSAIQTLGTGTGYYSPPNANVNSEAAGATYRLRDTVTSSSWMVTPQPEIQTYDDHNELIDLTLTNYSEDPDNNWANVGVVPRYDNQGAEVDVHRYASYVLSYYYTAHGLNSWDGAGAPVKLHAHNGYNGYMPNNAFWYPGYNQFYFGDGDGTNCDYVCTLDCVAHEFTHAVITGFNLFSVYDHETGALNEALADIFAALISLNYPLEEPQPWKNGDRFELIWNRGRNLADPCHDNNGIDRYNHTSEAAKLASYPFTPDYYSIRYTASGDSYGVHVNSTIVSHAVYLMINGGTAFHSGITVTGIGRTPVEEMLYYIISTPGFLPSTSQFADFRNTFILTCLTLYPDNLDYLVTVKKAFLAVGIGPDLYIRDTLADQGEEETGVASCMSPDIIVRQQPADALTLAGISDITNASLCQEMELGQENFVYFRIFNRGSVNAAGTLHLYLSPASTFPTPGSWVDAGSYPFPIVSAGGGFWIPLAATECITLPIALTNSLGVGHFCFIAIIESATDPPPDHMLISDVGEYCQFIAKSNNYAWRNCDIVNLIPNLPGDIPVIEQTFQFNDFGRKNVVRDLEIDARDVPENTQVLLWFPNTRPNLTAVEAIPMPGAFQVKKVAGALETPVVAQAQLRPIPLAQMTAVADIGKLDKNIAVVAKPQALSPLQVAPSKVVRLAGLSPAKNGKIEIRFSVKFPKNVGTRDVTLSFRERSQERVIGQMNYIFRIRNGTVTQAK